MRWLTLITLGIVLGILVGIAFATGHEIAVLAPVGISLWVALVAIGHELTTKPFRRARQTPRRESW